MPCNSSRLDNIVKNKFTFGLFEDLLMLYLHLSKGFILKINHVQLLDFIAPSCMLMRAQAPLFSCSHCVIKSPLVIQSGVEGVDISWSLEKELIDDFLMSVLLQYSCLLRHVLNILHLLKPLCLISIIKGLVIQSSTLYACTDSPMIFLLVNC